MYTCYYKGAMPKYFALNEYFQAQLGKSELCRGHTISILPKICTIYQSNTHLFQSEILTNYLTMEWQKADFNLFIEKAEHYNKGFQLSSLKRIFIIAIDSCWN